MIWGRSATRRIRVVFPVACAADVAWLAVHTPTVAAELYRPFMIMTPQRGALPGRFTSGSRIDVTLRALGMFPAGSQRIQIEDVELHGFPPGARTMRDAGRPLGGPLSLLRGWNHEITVWPVTPGAAVWHDELTIRGGFAPAISLVLGPMWRWRKAKLAKLARSWSYESLGATALPPSSASAISAPTTPAAPAHSDEEGSQPA